MTSNLAGTEPPLPIGNRSFPLPATRAASHDLHQTPRSWPRQTFNLTPSAPAGSQDVSEPALKRQKIGDPDTDSIGKASGTLPSILDTIYAANYKSALLNNNANHSPHNVSENNEEQQCSLFPTRPSRTAQPGGHQQGRALAIERANARDLVPVKPYVSESPSSAPQFHKASEWPLCCPLCLMRKHVYLAVTLRTSRLFPVDRTSRGGFP